MNCKYNVQHDYLKLLSRIDKETMQLFLTIFKLSGSYPNILNKVWRQILLKLCDEQSFEPIKLLSEVLGRKSLLPEKACKINLLTFRRPQ